MAFSNKSLVVLAIAVLALSVFGTSLSLNLIDSMSNVGYVDFDTGSVNLSINTTVSIVLNDSLIDFGTCTLSGGLMTFDSNSTAGTGDNPACNGTFPDFMTIENDGNIVANVSVEVDSLPTTEYANAAGAILAFKTANSSTRPGCGQIVGWTTFADVGPATSYPACGDLNTDNSGDRFDFYTRITMPDTAVDADDSSMGLTFRATAS